MVIYLSDGTEISFGGISDIDKKITTAYSVIDDMKKTENRPLTVDVSDPERVICRVKPLD